MSNPVANIEIDGMATDGLFNDQMPVTVNEIVNLFIFNYFLTILHEIFLVISHIMLFFRRSHGTTFAGEKAGNGKAVAWMQAAIQRAVGTECEDRFDELVAVVFGSQSIAVTHQTFFAIDNESLLLFEDNGAKFGAEIILHPHIMIACKVINDDTFFVQLAQFSKKQVIAARYHILVLKPIVENVAQQKQMGTAILDLVEPVYDFPFSKVAFLTIRCSQMEIGSEENMAVDGDRLLEDIHDFFRWNFLQK